MSHKILFVDDEQHLLASYSRNLRKNWNIDTALGGEMALEIFDTKGPFAVVVSDMRMPGMNGIQLLTKIKEKDPDVVRIMLSGNTDFNTAIEAINEGNIYRFLTKPCPPDILNKALKEAVQQYQLIKSEQELLNETLKGSIKILIEILSMIDAQSFSQSIRLRNYVKHMAEKIVELSTWEIEIAALLAQIGQVMIPKDVNEKFRKNQPMTDAELDLLKLIPKMGYDLLIKIPRIEDTAKIILYQDKLYNGEGYPFDDIKGKDIPIGARYLKILKDLMDLEEKGNTRKKSLEILMKHNGQYDVDLLQSIYDKLVITSGNTQPEKQATLTVKISELKLGYILVDCIQTISGQKLMTAGLQITRLHLLRIQNWLTFYKIKEPIRVIKKV